MMRELLEAPALRTEDPRPELIEPQQARDEHAVSPTTPLRVAIEPLNAASIDPIDRDRSITGKEGQRSDAHHGQLACAQILHSPVPTHPFSQPPGLSCPVISDAIITLSIRADLISTHT